MRPVHRSGGSTTWESDEIIFQSNMARLRAGPGGFTRPCLIQHARIPRQAGVPRPARCGMFEAPRERSRAVCSRRRTPNTTRRIPTMTTTPAAPAAGSRADLVHRDLDNVIHPIVPHRQLEERQLVIASAKDSTVVDVDGREYLDGMAGLWCVNIGYGRAELAEVASKQMQQLSYYPHTAMNAPAAALAEKVNGLLGGDNHVY